MKNLRLFIALLLFAPVFACTAQPSDKQVKTSDNNSDKIEAYYFHFTARCVTCKTIEARAKENLEALYPNQFKQGLMTFQSLNLEEAPNKVLAEKLGVSGQSLLIVKGEKKINLTNDGFMYAVVKPEKFKEIINEKVDGLMIR
ncbi:MAG: nitrophenyl compound nitroreductase subunit ArsF family protein [Flavobacteriaceae bacterium]|nr:nitrophenyl compound nitroreductase subunit ArsF family protein [Flavobacteriaceae bacterium]